MGKKDSASKGAKAPKAAKNAKVVEKAPAPAKASNGKAKKEKKPAVVAPPPPASSTSESESSDEEPSVVATVKSAVNGAAKAVADAVKPADSETSDDSSDSDAPAPVKAAPAKPAPAAAPKKAAKATKAKSAPAPAPAPVAEDSSDEESSDDEPAVKPVATNGAAAAAAEDSDDDSDDSSDDDEVKPVAAAPAAMAVDGEDSDDSDDDSSEEEVAPVKPADKKRKADDAALSTPAAKKTKNDAVATPGDAEITTCFIGQLSWNVDEAWLKSEFESIGPVTSARVVTDRESGRSKGFGYIEFGTAEHAKAALEYNGKEVDGRAIKVDLATPRAPRDAQSAGKKSFNSPAGGAAPNATLFIGNLSFDTVEDTVWDTFSPFGDINVVRLPTDRETGKPKGFCYVEFGSIDNATKAYEAGQAGIEADGRQLRIDYSTPREPRDDSGRGGRGGRGGFGRGGGRGFGDRGSRGGRGRGGDRGRGGSRGRGTDSGYAKRSGAVMGGAGKKTTF